MPGRTVGPAVDAAVAGYVSGLSMAAAGSQVGLTAKVVRRALRRLGIPLRSRDPWTSERAREAKAKYRADHRVELRAAGKAYYEANLDALRSKHRAYNQEHYAANAPAIRASKSAWSKAHREQERARNAAYRTSHSEAVAARLRAYRARNPEKAREWDNRKRARRAAAPTCNHAGCLTLGPIQLAWQTSPHRCYLCGTPIAFRAAMHMDHVVPLSRGGVHCASNLRPACAPCNQRKSSKLLTEIGVAL